MDLIFSSNDKTGVGFELSRFASFGTLGWTHSCGSGKSIARIVSGLQPEVDFAFS